MNVIINTQKAIYALLGAELDEDVYDHVPEDALLPYVTIGDISLSHMPDAAKSVYEMEFSFHAYDNGKGRKNLLEIAQSVFELLNGESLEIENFTHHETRLLSQVVGLSDEGAKYAMEANYRITVSE